MIQNPLNHPEQSGILNFTWVRAKFTFITVQKYKLTLTGMLYLLLYNKIFGLPYVPSRRSYAAILTHALKCIQKVTFWVSTHSLHLVQSLRIDPFKHVEFYFCSGPYNDIKPAYIIFPTILRYTLENELQTAKPFSCRQQCMAPLQFMNSEILGQAPLLEL